MRYILTLILLLTAGAAFAQMPMQQQPNAAEQNLSQEWGAYQLSQQHVSTAIVKLIEEWRKDRETMAAERHYWADYVKGLSEKSPVDGNSEVRNILMVDTVTSQIYDGARNVVVHLNSVSDGTGQVGVVILDPATLIPNPGTHLVLWRATYDVKGGGINVEWDGSPDKSLIAMSGSDTRDFSRWGGLRNDAAVSTGIVRISTVGFVANSGYSCTLEFKKGGPVGPGLGAFLRLGKALTEVETDLPTAPPVNVDVPHLMGEGNLGEVLECTMGNWDNVPRTYEFQWMSDGTVAKIDTSSDLYTVSDNDMGHSITCVVTARNVYGSASVTSNAVAVAGPTGMSSSAARSVPRVPLRK